MVCYFFFLFPFKHLRTYTLCTGHMKIIYQWFFFMRYNNICLWIKTHTTFMFTGMLHVFKSIYSIVLYAHSLNLTQPPLYEMHCLVYNLPCWRHFQSCVTKAQSVQDSLTFFFWTGHFFFLYLTSKDFPRCLFGSVTFKITFNINLAFCFICFQS